MREIKLRAWDKVNNRMLYFARLAWESEYNLLYFAEGELDVPCGANLEWMEFTGLHDKNCKEIWEGDITNNGVVTWRDDWNWDSGGSVHPGFYFVGKYVGRDSELDYHVSFDGETEVLGNIYENPELLDSWRFK